MISIKEFWTRLRVIIALPFLFIAAMIHKLREKING